MNSSERLMMENYLYLTSLLEEDEDGESDEEYVPREEWRQVRVCVCVCEGGGVSQW